MPHDAGQVDARDDVDAVYESRLTRVGVGHEDPLVSAPAKPARGHQHAIDVPHGPVERELAEKSRARRRLETLMGEQDRDRDRKVEAASVLAHLGRRQVDGEPSLRKRHPAVADRRTHAVARLLHGRRRQAHEKEVRLAVGCVRLHLDVPAFHSGKQA